MSAEVKQGLGYRLKYYTRMESMTANRISWKLACDKMISPEIISSQDALFLRGDQDRHVPDAMSGPGTRSRNGKSTAKQNGSYRYGSNTNIGPLIERLLDL